MQWVFSNIFRQTSWETFQIFQRKHATVFRKPHFSHRKIRFFPSGFWLQYCQKLPSHVKCHSHLLHWLLAMGTVGTVGFFWPSYGPNKWPKKHGTKMNEDVTPMDVTWIFPRNFLWRSEKKPWLINHQRWMFCTNEKGDFGPKNGWAKSVFRKTFSFPSSGRRFYSSETYRC